MPTEISKTEKDKYGISLSSLPEAGDREWAKRVKVRNNLKRKENLLEKGAEPENIHPHISYRKLLFRDAGFIALD